MTRFQHRSDQFDIHNWRTDGGPDEEARFFQALKTFPLHRRAKLIAIRESILAGHFETPERWAVALRALRRAIASAAIID